MVTPPDWYTRLNLPADATTQQITEAVERRSRQAAALANTAPERSQALREEVRAMKRDLLSGDEARWQYDASLVRPPEAPAPFEPPPAATPVPEQPASPDSASAAPLRADPAEPRPLWERAAPPVLPAPPVPTPPVPPPGYGPPAAPPTGYGTPTVGGWLRQVVQSAYTCTRCGTQTQPKDRFCANCGERLKPLRPYTPHAGPISHPMMCPYCGTVADPHHRFCRTCGAMRPQPDGGIQT